MDQGRNSSSALLRDGGPDSTKSQLRASDLVVIEKNEDSLDAFLKRDEPKPAETKKEMSPEEQSPPFMDSFLIELVHSIKNGLAAVYQATALTMEKYDDEQIRRRSHDQVKEEIRKIDSVLNSVLNFVNINTPITKSNTFYTILEEILEAGEKQFRQRKIRITKRYEKDIPETFIHPEQVRFILHSAVQYAILSTPPGEVIGFLVRSVDSRDGTGGETLTPEKSRRYIEAMIGFNGEGKPASKLENPPEIPGEQGSGVTDLILKLAKEVLERNHGRMAESHGEKLKTLIHLRFPVERRKVVYYEPIAL